MHFKNQYPAPAPQKHGNLLPTCKHSLINGDINAHNLLGTYRTLITSLRLSNANLRSCTVLEKPICHPDSGAYRTCCLLCVKCE